MMFHYPYSNYGYSRYGYRFPRYNYNNGYDYYNYSKKSKAKVEEKHKEKNDTVNKDETRFDSNDFCFDFMGIKLHFDDILLICLILFLYNEGVKDQNLFISLILLLLS